MTTTLDLTLGERIQSASRGLGSLSKLAEALQVNRSQPTRWLKGDEAPSRGNQKAILDIDHVVARARLLWGDDATVQAWLYSHEAHLDGARPIDIIVTRGTTDVIDALDLIEVGSFA